MNIYLITLRLFIFCFCFWSNAVYAHKPSDSYLTIAVKGSAIQGQWDIALRDLEYAIGLDEDANNEITWQEVINKQVEMKAYAFARLAIKNDQNICPIQVGNTLIDSHTDGAYAVFKFSAICKKDIQTLTLIYSLFSDIDPSHRGLLNLEFNNMTKTAIFGPDNSIQSLVLATTNPLIAFKDYAIEGIQHIWKGYDHILFLISLLLPAVLIRTGKSWAPSESFKLTFIDVLKVVTAFTIAHSITLTLASLHIVSLPSRWVEAAIAASVILAALNNIFPDILKKRWIAAFAFGLIHGFGFAAVLSDLGLHDGALIFALLGFNLGVEIGQIAILSIYLPITYSLRKTWFYKNILFYTGSMSIICIASVWFLERAFNLSLFASVSLLSIFD